MKGLARETIGHGTGMVRVCVLHDLSNSPCRTHAVNRVERLAKNYWDLPLHHRQMLPGMPDHIKRLKSAIDVNQRFVEMIIASAVGMFENSQVSQLVRNIIMYLCHMVEPEIFTNFTTCSH